MHLKVKIEKHLTGGNPFHTPPHPA
ncbi:hypothetical protein A2U01_0063599, partial [Trifolium medium]|nr:hypothetical protein [Trifolium medium]